MCGFLSCGLAGDWFPSAVEQFDVHRDLLDLHNKYTAYRTVITAPDTPPVAKTCDGSMLA
jgi:hypothetical protein